MTPGTLKESTPPRLPDSLLYRGYFAFLLYCSFFLSYADRQLFGVLITPIKNEFDVSDTVLGIMTGLAFGVFYALCSLPLAAIADRGNRTRLIAICLTLWSAATSLSGLARNVLMLGVARFAVGIGEAGGTPASISLISDLFTKKWRATAIAFYNAAGSLGGALVIIFGAWLASEYGWRAAFMIMGIPGFVLALLLLFTVREPMRGAADNNVEAASKAPSLMTTLRYVLARPTLVFAYLGAGASSALVAFTAWLPAFFQRSHELSLAQAGGVVGLSLLLAGPFGGIFGGFVSDRVGRRGVAFVLGFTALFAVFTGLAGVALILAPTVTTAIVAAVIWKIFATSFPGGIWSLSQSLVEVRMRATSQAFAGIIGNLLGYGGGPALIGVLSEHYRPEHGEESLRWALGTGFVLLSALAVLLYVVGAVFARLTTDKAAA